MVFLRNGEPALLLAPMEGVTDFPMRALLTELGGFKFCVSEFVRVTEETVPPKVFHRYVPELKTGGMTASGCPIIVQILGGDTEKMAEAAMTAIQLGARGVDINFGCPAPTVNRHDGGAVLLKEPHRIRDIVQGVRQAVPNHIPVSAKVRLGWEKIEEIFKIAESVIGGGANWITVHARTRSQGYARPVHWQMIAELKRACPIPVVANGDIHTIEDFRRCREITGCEHFMLGRGALAEPALAQMISAELEIQAQGKPEIQPYGETRENWLPLLQRFVQLGEPQAISPHYTTQRIKQWLNLAGRCYPISWADPIKRSSDLEEIWKVLQVGG